MEVDEQSSSFDGFETGSDAWERQSSPELEPVEDEAARYEIPRRQIAAVEVPMIVKNLDRLEKALESATPKSSVRPLNSPAVAKALTLDSFLMRRG